MTSRNTRRSFFQRIWAKMANRETSEIIIFSYDFWTRWLPIRVMPRWNIYQSSLVDCRRWTAGASHVRVSASVSSLQRTFFLFHCPEEEKQVLSRLFSVTFFSSVFEPDSGDDWIIAQHTWRAVIGQRRMFGDWSTKIAKWKRLFSAFFTIKMWLRLFPSSRLAWLTSVRAAHIFVYLYWICIKITSV